MLTVISFVKELQFSSTKLHCKLLFWWSVEWSASLWFIQDGILAIYSFPFKSWNVQNPIIFLCVKVNMSFHGRYFSSDPKLILSVTHFFIVTQSCCYMVCVCVFQQSVCQMGKLLLALREATLVPDFNCRMHFSLLVFSYVKRWITDSRVKKTLPPSIKSIFFKMALDAQLGISLYLHSFPPLLATNQLVFRSLLGLVQDTVLILLSRLLAHSLDPVWETTGSY